MSSHAPISPSRSERAVKCPGSTLAEEGVSDKAGAAAVEGSAGHAIAAYQLKNTLEKGVWPIQGTPCESPWIGSTTRDYLGYEPDEDDLRVGEVVITGELLDAINTYVSYVSSNRIATRGVVDRWLDLYIEKEVTIESISPEMGGTADCIIHRPFAALHIIDLKLGRSLVEVDNNYQLSYYALAALETYDANSIQLTIVQPRGRHPDGPIRTVDMDRDDLIDVWYPRFKRAYDLVDEERRSGVKSPRSVGPWCKWCKARLDCSEAVSAVRHTALSDFGSDSSDTRLDLMDKIEAIESYVEKLKAWGHERLTRGEEVPGYKLIRALGNRKWKDESTVRTVMGSDIYRKIMMSPAQLKKPKGKSAYEAIEKLCFREYGRPKMVRENNKNPAYIPGITDFEEKGRNE